MEGLVEYIMHKVEERKEAISNVDSQEELIETNALVFQNWPSATESSIKEYDIESTRKRDLEVRVGTLVAVISFLIGFYATGINFAGVKAKTDLLGSIGSITLFCFYSSPLVLFLVTIKKLINILGAKEYKRLDLNLISEEYFYMNEHEYATKIAISYKNIVEYNTKINDEKAIAFNNAVTWLYTSLIFLAIAYIINQAINKFF